MSSSTSSLSTLTTVPVTISPSSNSTMRGVDGVGERHAAEVVEDDDSFWPSSSSSSSALGRRRRLGGLGGARRWRPRVVGGFRGGLVGLAALLGDGGAGRLRHVLIRQLLTPRRWDARASLADRRARKAGPGLRPNAQATGRVRVEVAGRPAAARAGGARGGRASAACRAYAPGRDAVHRRRPRARRRARAARARGR